MATSSKRSITAITSVIFAFTFLPFILLVLVCISTPISDKLQLSQLYDGDGRLLINLGLLGACAKATDEGYILLTLSCGWQLMSRADYSKGANCVRKSMGYYVRPIFVMNSPDPSRRLSQIQLVHFEETWPLVLVPIAAGAVGVVMVLFAVAWSGGARKWARTLHIVTFSLYVFSTLVAWVAFGMCIRMTKEINNVLNGYIGWPAISLPMMAKYGNAVWLALAASILLLVATVLYGIKMFGKSAKSENTYHVNSKDVELDHVSSQ